MSQKINFLVVILVLMSTLAFSDPNQVQDFYGNIQRRADDLCIARDVLSNLCTDCYTGYYANKEGKCIKNNPLCLNTDLSGRCIECFKTFVLVNGYCYYEEVAKKLKDKVKPSDSLCQEWENGKCLKCLSGTYSINGVCTIVDPFCQSFDQILGKCQICLRNFMNVNGSCRRIIK